VNVGKVYFHDRIGNQIHRVPQGDARVSVAGCVQNDTVFFRLLDSFDQLSFVVALPGFHLDVELATQRL